MTEIIVPNHVKKLEQIKKLLHKADTTELDDVMWDMHEKRYDHRPPTIDEFLTNEYYLGGEAIDLTVYPLWKKALKRLHPSPFFNPFKECIIQGSIRTGKTFVPIISMVYELCKLICFKIPQKNFVGVNKDLPMTFFMFSVLKDNVEGNAWDYVKKFLKKSPFFNERFTVKETKHFSNNGIDLCKGLRIEIGSTIERTLSKAIIVAMMDEANFYPKDGYDAYINLSQRRKMQFYDKYTRQTPGILFLISQPVSDYGFIDQRVDAVRESKDRSTMILINISQWEAKKHTGIYNDRGIPNLIDPYFEVFVGVDNQEPFIVEGENQVRPDMQGEVLQIPVMYYTEFKRDLIESLKTIAGRSTVSSATLFKSEKFIKKAMGYKKSWFRTDGKNPEGIIELNLRDEDTKHIGLMDYIKDPKYFTDCACPEAYRFIHVDLAAGKQDKMGITSVYIEIDYKQYYKSPEKKKAKVEKKFFNVDFSIAITAKQGDEIPYTRIVEFFIYLRDELNYPLYQISTDQREGGRQFRQDLEDAGFEVKYISVDKYRDPYLTLKTLVYERYIILYYNELLKEELLCLKDDGNKINHPNNKSKDIADSLAGAVWAAFTSQDMYNDALLTEKLEGESDDMFDRIVNDQIMDQFADHFGWEEDNSWL